MCVSASSRIPSAAACAAAISLWTAAAGAQFAAPEQLQYLVDRAAIEHVLAEYARVIDFGTAEEYAALFTEDAVLTVQGQDYTGRGAIRAMIAPALRAPGDTGPPRLRHVLSNIVIDIQDDGTTATAFESWITISNRYENRPTIGAIGHYEDELTRVNGDWLISRRVIIVDMQPQASAP